jgi:hypothetical protein
MNMNVRTRPVLVLALTVALAACGGSTHKTASSATASTEGLGPSVSGSPTTAGNSPGTSMTAGTGPGHTPAASAGAGAGGGNPTNSPTGAAGSPSTKGPAPVLAGTYRFRQSGSSTVGSTTTAAPADGTMTVDPASSDGTQVFHRFVRAGQPPSDTTFSFQTSGMFITTVVTRMTVGTQTVAFTCTFNPPVPAPPWPPSVGATISGSGSCGSFTAQVTGRIDGTKTVTLDGAPVMVYVVDTTIVTHGQVESTQTQTDWFAPSLRLSVHNESRAKGTYGPFSFSSTLISDLESGRPS